MTVERQLFQAFNAISMAVALFDGEDRLVVCNRLYEEIPRGDFVPKPGVKFEDIVRAAVKAGSIPEARGREADWVACRLERDELPYERPVEVRRGDKWLMMSEHRLPNGGTLRIGLDVTARKEAEESERKAKESQQRFVEALDGIPVGFALWDAEDKFVFCNRLYLERAGSAFRKNLRPGVTFEQVIHDAVQSGLILEAEGREEDWIAERLARHREPPGPYEIHRADGWWVIDERRMADGSTMLVMHDITDLREVQEKRAKSERRYLNALDAVPMAIALYDAEDRFVFGNRQYRKQTALAKTGKLVPGVKFEDVVRYAVENGYFPESHGCEEEWMRRRMERHRHPQGPFEVRRAGEWRVIDEQRLSDGATLLVMHDVTELRQAQERQVEKEKHFLAALDAVPMGIALWDSEDRFVFSNRQYRQGTALAAAGRLEPGTPYEDVIRYAVSQGILPDAIGREEEWIQERLAHHRHPIASLEVRRNGRWLQIHEHRLADGSLLSVSRDITDRKQAEQEILRSNRALRTISTCNEALVRAKTEKELLNEICRVLTDIGGYRRAWVGLIDEAQPERVHPVAWSPPGEEAYFENCGKAVQDPDGPMGRAVRSMGVAVANGDGGVVEDCDCVSTVAMPLKGAEGVFGVLNVCVDEKQAIDADEVKLIEELANDISYGILALRETAERRRAEEALRDSESRFRDLVEGSIQGIVIHRDLGPLFANHAYARIFGYDTPEDVLHLATLEEHFAEHERERARCADGESRGSTEYECLRRDGTPIWVEHRTRLVDWKGEPAVQTIVIDISERKEAELALLRAMAEAEKARADLDDALISASDGFALYDQDQRLVLWNSAFERVFADASAALKPGLAYEDMLRDASAHGVVSVEEGRLEAWIGERLEYFQDHEAVDTFRLADGSWWQVSGQQTPRGGIAQVLTDVTGIKRREMELLGSEARFRGLIEGSVLGIIIHRHGKPLFVNKACAEVFGYESADEIVKLETLDLLADPGERERVAKDRVVAAVEYQGLRKDGGAIWIDQRNHVVNWDGEWAIQSTMVDVTERKRIETERAAMEQERLQTHKMEAIGQLAGGIAHEINTPIQYIGDNLRFIDEAVGDFQGVLEGYHKLAAAVKEAGVLDDIVAAADAVAKKADLDFLLEELPNAVRQSLGGVEHVARIVMAMKEFSHPASEQKTANNLNEVIENTAMVSRNEWKYVAELETDLDPGLPLVTCLAGPLGQVVLNVIVNAAHAIAAKIGGGKGNEPEQKGKITIATRAEGDWAEIRISDTGSGIPKELRERIFEPFFTTKDVGQGTGQGLAISRDIVVNKHGGKLWFESEPGQGSTFFIRLPIDGGNGGSGSGNGAR